MARREKLEFEGSHGETLAGLLEHPTTQARGVALFAHCFTCGKDVVAASRIARALTEHGFSVLRFDFTGLGGSDGDFANTHFSSNVDDLVKAAEFLTARNLAPTLLLGHSLGGTAVLRAARRIDSCRGVVTIGSPADAGHVSKQFHAQVPDIERDGEAEVDLAGRRFTIRRSFLDDIANTSIDDIAGFDRALLVMHSPVDETVALEQAERIYKAARHPKSFVSLGRADHLLTQAEDAAFVADIVSAWASRLAPIEVPSRPRVKSGEVVVDERDHAFMLDVYSDHHRWLADEPERVGGQNAGADPYEHLLAALGTCTAMTIRLYAGRKRWPLDNVRVTLRHSREHREDCDDCDTRERQLDVLEREIELTGSLDDDQRTRLMEIADRCPVHRTLHGPLEIRTNAA